MGVADAEAEGVGVDLLLSILGVADGVEESEGSAVGVCVIKITFTVFSEGRGDTKVLFLVMKKYVPPPTKIRLPNITSIFPKLFELSYTTSL